jgi:hypothetical protein
MSNEQKPSSNEDEYFVRKDAELLRAKRAELDAQRLAAERHSHFMKCPKCGAALAEHLFHHMKIDRCTECQGVWLDAGELEQLAQVKDGTVERFVKTLFGSLPA